MSAIFATMFAIAGLLTVISALPVLARRLRVPYSVVLAVVGIIVGFVSAYGVNFGLGGPVGDLLASWNDFSSTSSIFMLVFLPILLFEASVAIDLRELLDDLFPVLLLAVVAVIVTTFLVGGALAAIGPFSLITGLLIASIVSTTDPAAVVAIFRDLGAPRRLSLLVEGEAVFNDAAAITLFSMFLATMTQGIELNVETGVILFLEHFFGGTLIGVTLAWGVNLLVPFLRNDRFAEMTLTIGGTYFAYLVTEHYLKASGVVAVVVFAIAFGTLGRTRIAPDNWRYLRSSWAMLGFWANSLIFILAAMLAPKTLATFTWIDLVMLVALVVTALAARAFVLFGLMPVLYRAKLALPIANSHKVVIVWGGLRGAVTAALALAATENPLLAPDIKHHVGVLATTFVMWTLLVNGLTLKPLIRALGLDRLSPVDLATRDRVMALSLADVKAKTEDMAADHMVDSRAAAEVVGYYDQRLAALDHVTDDAALATAGLITLAHRERSIYFEMFDHRVIERSDMTVLAARTGRLVEGAKAGGVRGYIKGARKTLAFTRSFRIALWLQRRLRIHYMLAAALQDRLEHLLIVQAGLRELTFYLDRTLERVFGARAVDLLRRLVASRLAAVEEALDALKLQYPDYARDAQARYLARGALVQEVNAYREMLREGVLGQEMFDAMMREVDERRSRLGRPPHLDLRLSAAALLAKLPWFEKLEPALLADLGKLLKPRLAVPGERILIKGAKSDGMYFVSSGAVEVMAVGGPVRLGSGAFFGEMGLVFDQPRSADVAALGYCQLLFLARRDFDRLSIRHPQVSAAITTIARDRLPALAG